MNLTESVPVVIPRILTGRMTDRLVLIAPRDQPAVDVVFMGVTHSTLDYHQIDQGTDRRLLDVLQHPDHDLAAALQHPQDRRLLLRQRPSAAFPFQASASPDPPFFLTSSGCPLCPATT